jgi:hypothetical protein
MLWNGKFSRGTRTHLSHAAFFRDADLPPEVSSRYKVGLLLREPTFCDASHKFGGFLARHRYLIISANARCVDELVQDCDWGLFRARAVRRAIQHCRRPSSPNTNQYRIVVAEGLMSSDPSHLELKFVAL